MKNAVYRDGHLHVNARQCETCIFRPGNLMKLRAGTVEQLVKQALQAECCIPCHDTLGPEAAICRGFWNRHRRDVLVLRLAQAFGNIRLVNSRKMKK